MSHGGPLIVHKHLYPMHWSPSSLDNPTAIPTRHSSWKSEIHNLSRSSWAYEIGCYRGGRLSTFSFLSRTTAMQPGHSDSWYVQISIRDYLAPQPPPGTGANYPACIVEYETPKLGTRYPKVNNNLAQGTDVYYLNTTDLYHPETPPILNPPLPATFRIDLEAIRAIIIATRRP